jgi:hypothetical protein
MITIPPLHCTEPLHTINKKKGARRRDGTNEKKRKKLGPPRNLANEFLDNHVDREKRRWSGPGPTCATAW